MVRFNLKSIFVCLFAWFLCWSGAGAEIQMSSFSRPVPKVVVPTSPRRAIVSPQMTSAGTKITYPWKTHVTCTIFWIGEKPSGRNPTPNHKSSWDQNWATNFGGFDDPDPANRVANHVTGDFRPKNFIPKLNPFYIALPYNDVQGWGAHKPEAAKVIPWFSRMNPLPGKSVCKGRWIQVFNGKISCFAQWEDCGPWTTDDYEFVFGSKPPKTRENGAAGIDLSPSVRDFLGLKSGYKVHWRFVEAAQVPPGPWKNYGPQNVLPPDGNLLADRRHLDTLRKSRDAEYQRKTLDQIRN